MGDKKKSMQDKVLCKLCKDDCIKKCLEEYVELVNDPKYICKKCGRLANKQKNLCKPVKI
ncbi:hypothetical protein [Desulfuribacillus alkaliarsenatis]|uniref:Uncharacterized protein n=1 Tax=Desulfuribacillus alkaliarsenatis TaxID=766136 RepID=A0A1E5FZ53_9FIRM|nr:hypothetical protein [Desulfuribacillus alkaliarsenatis]OEF95855.1 hypothetical protein BHF68_10690 [Desulfuribacillus alkaliarsenatis]